MDQPQLSIDHRMEPLAPGLSLGKFRIERGDVKNGKKMLQEAAGIFERLGMKAGDRVRKVVDELG